MKIEYYPFSDSSGLFGYTDSIGKWLIEPTYDDAGFFYNGIAVVEQNGKLGLVKKNEQIVNFIFDEIETDMELFVVSSMTISGSSAGTVILFLIQHLRIFLF